MMGMMRPGMPNAPHGRGGGGAGRFGVIEKPKNAKGTLLRLVSIYTRFKGPIITAILLTVATSGISVVTPLLAGKVFDTFDLETNALDVQTFTALLAALLTAHICTWIIGTLNGFIMLKVSQKLVYVLRGEFFDKLQRLPLGFFDTRPHGDTMSRITNDADNVSSVIAQTTTQLTASLFTLVGSVIVMVSLSVELTGVVMLCIPLVFLLTKAIASRSRKFFRAQQAALGRLNGMIEENITGMKMVKAFGRRDDVMAQFHEINEELYHNSRTAQVWAGYMMPLLNVINNLIFALVALTGGFLCVVHGMRISVVVSFLTYSKQFAHPLNSIAGMFSTIQSALAGAERVFEVLDCVEEAADLPDAVDIGEVEGSVRFERVDFSYEEGKPILKGVDFEVKKGEVVALVGETGAGKTTIVNLLMRFYELNGGKIYIDGKDILSIKRNSLRKCFSVVLQDTCLFTGTIADNIRYSNTGASMEDVVRAAKLAQAHDFIEKLPDGYNTVVSGETDNLSQGQRQLLAISRAVLCGSSILILDEATSSVDTKTEKAIQNAMVRLIKNRTSFLIAHRLSTIRDADRIMLIGDGTILESGTHDELMKLGGTYCEMVISQTGGSAGGVSGAEKAGIEAAG